MQSSISVLAELERLGVKYAWAGSDEIKVCCPFHADDNPSCAVNVKSGVFKCHGCQVDGEIVGLLAGFCKVGRSVMLEELATRYELNDIRLVDPRVIDRWCDGIWQAGALLTALRERGIDERLIKKYKLGEDRGRISIPVFNVAGDAVNVRRYLPGAPGHEKMKNMRGRGSARFYPLWPTDQLAFDAVMLTGGEMKAIVAADQLNKHGIGAVCVTIGEKLIPPELLRRFAGKVVYVAMDVDEAGRKAALNNCRALFYVAAEVHDINLPLELERFPHGDINDFVVHGGDLWTLIQNSEPWSPPTGLDGHAEDEEPADLTLTAAANARYVGRRVRVAGVVSMMATAPYVVPKVLKVKCDRDQPMCAICPVFHATEDTEHQVHPENAAILEVIETTKGNVRGAMMNALQIPPLCRVCAIEPLSYYNAEAVQVVPQLEITNRSSDRALQPAVCIGEGLELNEDYIFEGRVWPSPKTQQSTLLISKYKPTADALSTYSPSADDLTRLRMFRPREWCIEALAERLGELYADLETNVTRVWRRRSLHLGIDLAYHSPLFLPFDGRPVKGWTEVLVIGDTAQGKSEAACGSGRPGGLMMHYGLGTKVECKNATAAGLLGGLQSVGGKFMVSWGVIPTHDKRLVILEELKGTSTEAIGKLTDMRSSGVAELPKIEKRRTFARTRLLALSNPRSPRPLSAYGFGVEAIQELIGNPEDVRRFDLALVLAADEVDASALNALRDSRPTIEHRHTDELCRSLVLWAWTRDTRQVEFTDGAIDAVLKGSSRLCEQFTDAVPLIDRGSMRHKLARLAAALAARTFSADDSGEHLLVRPCHAEYIEGFLREEYSKPSTGYARYTESLRATDELLDPDQLLHAISALPFAVDVAQALLRAERFDVQDVQDWCAWDFVESRAFVSLLVRKHALVRDGRMYRKTPAFVAFLRSSLDNKKIAPRPSHLSDSTLSSTQEF